MQWTPDRNGGFCQADPPRLYLPPIMDPVYGYQAVNVEAQQRNIGSLLQWTRRMIEIRKQHPVFGTGIYEELTSSNPSVLAYVRLPDASADGDSDGSDRILCVNNLSRFPQPVELDLRRFSGVTPVECMGGVVFPRIGELTYLLTLPGHGFYWFQLPAAKDEGGGCPRQPHPGHRRSPARACREPPAMTPGRPGNRPARVCPDRHGEVVNAHDFEDTLAAWLVDQRWFAGKGRIVHDLAVVADTEIIPGDPGLRHLLVTVSHGATSDCYQLFVGFRARLPAAAARQHRRARRLHIYDGLHDSALTRPLLDAIIDDRSVGVLRFCRCPGPRFYGVLGRGRPGQPGAHRRAEQHQPGVRRVRHLQGVPPVAPGRTRTWRWPRR